MPKWYSKKNIVHIWFVVAGVGGRGGQLGVVVGGGGGGFQVRLDLIHQNVCFYLPLLFQVKIQQCCNGLDPILLGSTFASIPRDIVPRILLLLGSMSLGMVAAVRWTLISLVSSSSRDILVCWQIPAQNVTNIKQGCAATAPSLSGSPLSSKRKIEPVRFVCLSICQIFYHNFKH